MQIFFWDIRKTERENRKWTKSITTFFSFSAEEKRRPSFGSDLTVFRGSQFGCGFFFDESNLKFKRSESVVESIVVVFPNILGSEGRTLSL